MIQTQRIRVRGVPFPHLKATGNVDGEKDLDRGYRECHRWTEKGKRPFRLVRVTFKLSREKFREVNPYGTDLDNLLKRFFDALSQTVFSDAPGKDACVVAIEAAKALVLNPSESGVDGEIIELASTN